jgi:hypothetical protein
MIMGFDEKNCKNLQLRKKFNFFEIKTTTDLSLGHHKGRPIDRRAFSPLKRTCSTSKYGIS